ncbi:hypothetical protein J6590_050678 [Homalodisca vitripennis]|nr:hypothetical protein J6590_050678 [Homalodisca vitripennis]
MSNDTLESCHRGTVAHIRFSVVEVSSYVRASATRARRSPRRRKGKIRIDRLKLEFQPSRACPVQNSVVRDQERFPAPRPVRYRCDKSPAHLR